MINSRKIGLQTRLRDVAKTLDVNAKEIDGLVKLIDTRLSLIDNYKNIKVKNYIDKVDFSLLWNGFKPLKFALYNS